MIELKNLQQNDVRVAGWLLHYMCLGMLRLLFACLPIKGSSALRRRFASAVDHPNMFLFDRYMARKIAASTDPYIKAVRNCLILMMDYSRELTASSTAANRMFHSLPIEIQAMEIYKAILPECLLRSGKPLEKMYSYLQSVPMQLYWVCQLLESDQVNVDTIMRACINSEVIEKYFMRINRSEKLYLCKLASLKREFVLNSEHSNKFLPVNIIKKLKTKNYKNETIN